MRALLASCAPMSAKRQSDAPPPDLTDDAILGGRLRLWQPRRGHRFGHDAILLAAATPASARAVDLGAGVGAAGLALAARVPGLRVTLADVSADLAALAALNAARNQLAARVDAVALDVTASTADYKAAGLPPECCDAVLMNPPFNDPTRHQPSPDRRRRVAHDLAPASLATWIDAAARLLRQSGVLTVIFRADGLVDLIGALAGRFGAIAVLPVHGKPGARA